MSASMKVAFGTFRRAISSWVAEMSTPVTSLPSASAAVMGMPAPQPSSRTSLPGGMSSSARAR